MPTLPQRNRRMTMLFMLICTAAGVTVGMAVSRLLPPSWEAAVILAVSALVFTDIWRTRPMPCSYCGRKPAIPFSKVERSVVNPRAWSRRDSYHWLCFDHFDQLLPKE